VFAVDVSLDAIHRGITAHALAAIQSTIYKLQEEYYRASNAAASSSNLDTPPASQAGSVCGGYGQGFSGKAIIVFAVFTLTSSRFFRHLLAKQEYL
jgi:hypothetical protein